MVITAAQFQSGLKVDREQKVAIVVARFNEKICQGLLDGALRVLEELEMPKDNIDVIWVPGAFEIPLVSKKLAASQKYAGVVALGCVIRGDTAHFDYVCLAATHGCLQAGLDTGVPVSFGVITVENQEQAVERASANDFNKGREATLAVLETMQTLKALTV